MTKEELFAKAMMLPVLPGVYTICGSKEEIIYIGKAKRLKERVSQYFRDGVPHDTKTNRMIFAARSFDVIITQTETEALTLECSQIKMHRPKYNILLKDDKGYSYIKIGGGEWPRITAELQKNDDSAEYIGPFMSSFAVKQMVQTVNDSFMLPRCSRVFPRDIGKGRPCLYSHIGMCMAVCSGKITKGVYTQAVQDAIYMIKQGKGELVQMLRQRMEKSAENLEFERAALLRDQINAISRVKEAQTVVTQGDKEQDVIAFAGVPNAVCAAVLRFREGRLVDKREYVFYDTGDINLLREEFLPRYYVNDQEEVPRIIAVDAPVQGSEILAELLSQKRGIKVRIYTPERGDNATLIKTAYLNAVERLARETGRTRKEEKVLDELAILLGLPSAPITIESYDISNWGDGTSVCGMIVYESGKPKKAGYRRFKVKTVEGTDDYSSMAEVLGRREGEFEKATDAQFSIKPDLIMLDGGKGQVSVVKKILRGTLFEDVPLFGMVKDNRHRTRGIIDSEGAEIVLSMHRSVFSFVTSLQDEVHRFAIDYQRRNAKNKMLSSTLVKIPGVGPATAKLLMAQFKTVKGVSEAELQDLECVKGVSKKTAKAVWGYFDTGK